ncbi:MAG: hypothetical protein WCB99_08905 [Candidatus Cybelea sp.]
MGYQQQTRDLTKQYLSFGRVLNDWRPIANTTYLPGMNVQLVPLDQQQYPDQGTVQPSGTAVTTSLVVGVVSETWPGFSGAGLPTTFLSPNSVILARGTQGVLTVEQGYHPAVLIDNSGTGAAAITNGSLLIPSRATAGYAQGISTFPAGGDMATVGTAMLPSTGIGGTIGTGVLAQASQTATVATPAIGDVLNLTIQMPYTPGAPGVVQTQTFSQTVTSTVVATVGSAFAAFLNGQAGFAQFYTATAAAGVVTVAVNNLATPFQVTFGSGSTVTSQFNIGLSGTAGNTITFASTASGPGGTSFLAGGATLAGGTGYKGSIPAFITGANC